MASSQPTLEGNAISVADDRSRRVAIVSALVVLALVWAAAVDVRGVQGSPGIPLDAFWASTMGVVRTRLLTTVAQVFAWLGGWPGSFLVAASVVLVLWWRRGARTALVFVVVALLSESNVNLMKAVDLRVRPRGGLWGGIGSFPSGHTAYAAVLAVTFGMLFHRAAVWVAGVAFVVAMALSRTVLDDHWLTDTLGGAACGAALAVLGWSLARPILEPGR